MITGKYLRISTKKNRLTLSDTNATTNMTEKISRKEENSPSPPLGTSKAVKNLTGMKLYRDFLRRKT